MKDLIILVADQNMRDCIEGLMIRNTYLTMTKSQVHQKKRLKRHYILVENADLLLFINRLLLMFLLKVALISHS